MINIRSILAATDFSAGARHAAERAAMLAAALGVRKGVLLHVLERSWLDYLKQLAGAPPDVEKGPVDAAAHALAGLADEIRTRSGFALDPQVGVGKTPDAIVDAGEGVDLLALGARGQHPLRALALGTTAERLLRKTRRPVLVVKRAPDAPYERVVVAVDFSPHSAKALAYGCAVAAGAEINLVHVWESPFEGMMRYASVSDETVNAHRAITRQTAEADMARFVDNSGLRPKHALRFIEEGYAPDRLRERARDRDADLIVVGKHGKSLTDELLLGSVTLHLLAESDCDVLVVQ
jgi:nucleotide-binding universal stress UspA family protein